MPEIAKRVPLLQRLFPSSGTLVVQPREVSETVSLVHPWPGRAEGMLGAKAVQLAAGPALTPSATFFSNSFGVGVGSGGILAEDWVEIFVGDVSHDSATSRSVQLSLVSPGPAAFVTFLARWSGFQSVRANGVPSGFEPMFGTRAINAAGTDVHTAPRPIVLPVGWGLRVDGDTAAANYTITLSMGFRIHTAHESPLLY